MGLRKNILPSSFFFRVVVELGLFIFSFLFILRAGQHNDVRITATRICDIKRHEIHRLDSSRSSARFQLISRYIMISK